MAFILLESKRDDLLLPYLNILQKKGYEKPLGLFKKDMLTKLSGQASLPNVSLGSNFYLVGAVRYYFNGDLTTDGRAAYLETGDPLSQDNWNVEVCRKLNAVINILRNAHIDTVGTAFEQPEDFGTLPIARLFRKYGKKIEAEISNESDETPAEGRNRLGNGYTYKIIRNFNEASEYCALTSPGAWCITRQPNWFNDYKRNYGIHYIFFLKDGYETLNRADFPGEGYTKQKPHDEYGNSMIAMLQRNDNWQPKIITSRWNHGDRSDGTQGTEADHAYTTGEFCQITGITEEDLKRIYEEWRSKEGMYTDRAEEKRVLLGVTRKLKYAQILINGGEKPSTALRGVGAKIQKTIWGKEGDENKSAVLGSIDDYSFLMDRGSIVFETISKSADICSLDDEWNFEGKYPSLNSGVLLKYENYSMIYNIRYREFVSIEGITKFKRIPDMTYNKSGIRFFEVKNSKNTTALISVSDLRPLKLPNGKSWFLYLRSESYWAEQQATTIETAFIRDNFVGVMELWISKSRNIFYNLRTNKFFDSSILSEEDKKELRDNDYGDSSTWVYALNSSCTSKGYFAISAFRLWQNTVVKANLYGKYMNCAIFDTSGKRITIGDKKVFNNPSNVADELFSFIVENGYYQTDNYYDVVNKRVLSINGEPVNFVRNWSRHVNRWSSRNCDDVYYIMDALKPNQYNDTRVVIYDLKSGQFFENPLGWPDKMSFYKPKIACPSPDVDPSDVCGYGSVGFDEVYESKNFPYIVLPTESVPDQYVFRCHYQEEHPGCSWSDSERARDEFIAQISIVTPMSTLRKLPADAKPEQAAMGNSQPAYSAQGLNESDIREIVRAAINEIRKKMK